MASKTATAVAAALVRRSSLTRSTRTTALLPDPTSTFLPTSPNTTGGGSRSIASVTMPKFEKKIIKVPTMGDSITEGTIVEWTVEIGQAVQDGDVVALVETDKVTVEIKAQGNGVMTQRFGAIEETVEVGAKLYEIDTDGTATFEGTPSSVESSEVPTETVTAPNPAVNSGSHHRLPSIKFLGKQGWQTARKGHGEEVPAATAAAKPNAVRIDHVMLHPMYGRPRFTEMEMEALLTGGASIAPSILMHSGGAKFK